MKNPFSNLSRRSQALLWFAIVAAVIVALLFFGQIPLLYLFSTFGLIVLLLVVAFADLEHMEFGNLSDQ